MNTSPNQAGFYVAGFLDLVGTKERMCQIEDAQTNQDKANLLGHFAQQVKVFRDDFNRMLEGAEIVQAEWDQACPDSLKARREAFKGHPVETHMFSDTVVIHTLLAITDRKVPVSSIWRLLAATTAATLFSLARGIPIRGGIEIGFATNLGSGEIFGPAIVDAIKLEGLADWPRVLIGDKLRDYIKAISCGKTHSDEESLNQQFAKLSQSLFCLDPKGVAMLNVKSDMMELLLGPDHHRDRLDRALSFSGKEYARFCGIGDAKLAGRYAVLSGYLNTSFEKGD